MSQMEHNWEKLSLSKGFMIPSPTNAEWWLEKELSLREYLRSYISVSRHDKDYHA